jgi:hypothetical protein
VTQDEQVVQTVSGMSLMGRNERRKSEIVKKHTSLPSPVAASRSSVLQLLLPRGMPSYANRSYKEGKGKRLHTPECKRERRCQGRPQARFQCIQGVKGCANAEDVCRRGGGAERNRMGQMAGRCVDDREAETRGRYVGWTMGGKINTL